MVAKYSSVTVSPHLHPFLFEKVLDYEFKKEQQQKRHFALYLLRELTTLEKQNLHNPLM